jgi:iron complex outermembrane recepter protein
MDSRWNASRDTGRFHSSLLRAIAALLLCLGSPSVWGAPPTDFHIEAGDATLTLNEFSRQAGLQLLFDFSVVRGRTTQAVKGPYEPRDALRRMLASTGLTFDFVNPRTLAVTPIKVASAAGSAQAPGPATGTKHPERRESPQLVERTPGNVAVLPTPFDQIETVRITGTNLRGESPVGAQILSLDRAAIDESGATTTADLLSTVSQIFGGGPTQDTHIVGSEAQTNSGFGTGINLRGLGARATLVLINGRRLAPGGTEAAFVDISNIPLSAVQRIDVLPDSESALYGADAVGGVVNFIMRDNFTGSETLLDSGAGPGGSLKSHFASQTIGGSWHSGHGMLSVEYYDRDALAASERAYTVSDLRPFGGSDFDTPLSNPGTLIAGGRTYALPAGQNGAQLSLSSLSPGTQNLQDRFIGADAMPQQRRLSLYGSGRQDFDGALSVFVNALLVERRAQDSAGGVPVTLPIPSTNPFLPSGAAGLAAVEYNFRDDLGPARTDALVRTTNLAVGADYDAGASWAIHAYAALARERQHDTGSGFVNFSAVPSALADPDPATALNPFGDGSHTNPQTLQSLAASTVFDVDSQLKIVDITADGTLFGLPGGDLNLPTGIDRRDQYYFTFSPPSASQPVERAQLSRSTLAGFSELVIPLFGNRNSRPGLRRLEISAAARYEDYEGFGHATTPKYGFTWSPIGSLSFRGTWSRSLRAPTLADLNESFNTAQRAQLNSSAPGGSVPALAWTGKNAQLTEERARSWTTGFDFTPERVKGLTVGVTWFDIDFIDRIQAADFSPNALTDPRYANLVIRSPDSALVNEICTHSILLTVTSAQCVALGSGTILDLRTHNVETLRTRGIDFGAKYAHEAGSGAWKMGLAGTYLLDYSLVEGSGAPSVDLLNTQNNPINLRLRGSLGWTGRRFGWDAMLNYTNSYRDTASNPNRPVAAWTTIDAQAHYEVGRNEGGWLQGVRLELNAVNLFNRPPPFLNNQSVALGYDQENADPYGRLISVQIRKNW